MYNSWVPSTQCLWKFLFLSYDPKYSWPISLQDISNSNTWKCNCFTGIEVVFFPPRCLVSIVVTNWFSFFPWFLLFIPRHVQLWPQSIWLQGSWYINNTRKVWAVKLLKNIQKRRSYSLLLYRHSQAWLSVSQIA